MLRRAVVLSVLATSVALAQQPPEPPTLDALVAAPSHRLDGVLDRLDTGDGSPLPERTFTIELPDPFRRRDDLGGALGHIAAFDVEFGAPRFYVGRDVGEPHLGADLDGPSLGYDSVLDHGARDGLQWVSRVRTMQLAYLRANRRTMRPLPPGETTWIELDVRTLRIYPDGTHVRCAADLVPFSHRRHHTTRTAIDWLVARCASVALE